MHMYVCMYVCMYVRTYMYKLNINPDPNSLLDLVQSTHNFKDKQLQIRLSPTVGLWSCDMLHLHYGTCAVEHCGVCVCVWVCYTMEPVLWSTVVCVCVCVEVCYTMEPELWRGRHYEVHGVEVVCMNPVVHGVEVVCMSPVVHGVEVVCMSPVVHGVEVVWDRETVCVCPMILSKQEDGAL